MEWNITCKLSSLTLEHEQHSDTKSQCTKQLTSVLASECSWMFDIFVELAVVAVVQHPLCSTLQHNI